jgi:hypothetical protein
VSIVLHVQGGQIVDYAINESGRRPELINFVDKRLRRLLENEGVNILPDQDERRDIWFPTQLDGFTCGLRQYEILRVMIERLNERYHLHGVDKLYDESLWGPMSGDFQPSKVRQLMMGICACRAMKHLNYKARLSVTPREKIRGFKGPRYVRRLDAFDGLEPVQSQQGIPGRVPRAGGRAKKPTLDVIDDVQDVTDLPRQNSQRVTRSTTSGPYFGF